MVDSCGFMHAARVLPAHWHDRCGSVILATDLEKKGYRDHVQKIVGDQGFSGKISRLAWRVFLDSEFELPKRERGKGRGFVVEAKGWIVERTLAWVVRCRRLVMDYEKTVESSEGWLTLSGINTLLGRCRKREVAG